MEEYEIDGRRCHLFGGRQADAAGLWQRAVWREGAGYVRVASAIIAFVFAGAGSWDQSVPGME